MIRVETDCFVKVGNGFINLTIGFLRQTTIEEGFSIVGFDFNGFIKVLYRFIITSFIFT